MLLAECVCIQVERFRGANENLEGELREERLEHDRITASLALAQLTATELEKVNKNLVYFSNMICSLYFRTLEREMRPCKVY